jgi:hypothetical protein
MKVSTAIELLKELDPDTQICAQWYDKSDVSYGDDTITDEVWEEANFIFDKWEFSDMRYLLDDAVRQAKQNLAKGN